MKTCWKCKTEQSLTEFYKDSKQPDGKQKACKACQKARNLEYGATHKEYFKDKNVTRYKKSVSDNPEFNKERYANARKDFINRSVEYKRTVKGSIMGLLGSAKRRAILKKIPCELDFEFLFNMYETQGGKCQLTQLPFTTFASSGTGATGYNPYNISIDRIDNKKGYTKDNVRLVLVCVNIAINAFGADHFENIASEFLKMRGFKLNKI